MRLPCMSPISRAVVKSWTSPAARVRAGFLELLAEQDVIPAIGVERNPDPFEL